MTCISSLWNWLETVLCDVYFVNVFCDWYFVMCDLLLKTSAILITLRWCSMSCLKIHVMLCYSCLKLQFVKLVNYDAFYAYCMYGISLVLFDLMKLNTHFCFLCSKKVKKTLSHMQIKHRSFTVKYGHSCTVEH